MLFLEHSVVSQYQTLWQYSHGDTLMGRRMQVGYEKNSLFSTSISLHHVLLTVRPSTVVNRVPPDRGKSVTLIGGVCLQHLSEARVTVLVLPFCCCAMLCDR